MLRAMWIRQGKRLRRRYFGALKMELYGQVFHYKRKAVLSEAFIKEAGLDNPATFDVVCETLKTDYGIHILNKVPEVETKPKKSKKSAIKSVAGETTTAVETEAGVEGTSNE